MTSFGGFEAVREMWSDALGTVYAARKAGTSDDPRFAIKSRRPMRRLDDNEEVSPAPKPTPSSDSRPDPVVAVFLESAHAQKALADKAPGSWATIHEIGTLSDGTGFYVTDLARLGSSKKLAASKVRFGARALGLFASSVVEGLRSAEQIARRGHGNLRPANVLITLITGDDNLEHAQVRLTDPVGGSSSSLQKDRSADLRALGELIVLQVAHEPTRGAWPIAPGPAWAGLGKLGPRWLELVNRLLDPNEQSARLTLDELSSAIAGLTPRPVRKAPRIAAMVAIVVLLVLGAVLVLRGDPRDRIVPGRGVQVLAYTQWTDPADTKFKATWERYCTQADCLAGLYNATSADPKLQAKLTEAGLPSISGLYKKLVNSDEPGFEGRDLSPWAMLDRDDKSWVPSMASNDLANPKSKARTDEGVKFASKGLEIVAPLIGALTSPEAWPVRDAIERAKARFAQRGWKGPEAALDTALKALTPKIGSGMVTPIRQAIDLSARLALAEESWTKIETMASEGSDANAVEKRARIARLISESNDPVLQSFVENARASIASQFAGSASGSGADAITTIDALSKGLEPWIAVASDTARLVESENIDFDMVETDKHKALRDPSVAGLDRARRWVELANVNKQLDPELDPRKKFPPVERFAQLKAAADTLAAKPVPRKISDDLEKQLSAGLSGASTLAGMKWKLKNREQIEGQTRESEGLFKDLDTTLHALKRERDELIAGGERLTREHLDRPVDVLGTGLDKAALVVSKWRSALKARVNSESFYDVREASDALDTALRTAIDEFRGTVAGDAGTKSPAPTDAAWSRELAKVVTASVEQSLADALAKLPLDDKALPPVSTEAVLAATRGATRSQQQFARSVTAIEVELAKVQSELDKGFTIAGDTESPQAKASLDRAIAVDVWKDERVQGAIATLTQRVELGRSLAVERSPVKLLDAIRSPTSAERPETALLALARLAQSEPAWPLTSTQFEEAKALSALVAKPLAAMKPDSAGKNPERVKTITSQALVAIWLRFANNASTPEAMEQALGAMSDFGVAAPTLPERLKYNLSLRTLRARLDASKGKLADSGISETLKEFLSNGGGGGGGGAGGAAVGDAGLRARLTEIASDQEPRFDPTKAGPGTPGASAWPGEEVAEGGLVRFTKAGVSLEFLPVGNAQEGTAYICTTECSLAQLVAIVDSAKAWKALADVVNTEPEPPCAWTMTSGRLVLNRLWNPGTASINAKNPAYAAGLLVAGSALELRPEAGGQPTLKHPVQAITPTGAALVAKAVGCRLPTSAEWQLAFTTYLSGKKPSDALLRGEAFRQQLAHVNAQKKANPLADSTDFVSPFARVFPSGIEDSEQPAEASTTLFFVPVDSGSGPMHHLVGNVAEFVFDNKAAFDAATIETIPDVLENDPAKVGVIGGSSLSPPSKPVGTAQGGLLSTQLRGEGFADVGFRLAFSAKNARRSLQARANDELAKATYLLAARRE